MGVLDVVLNRTEKDGSQLPDSLLLRLDRGRKSMMKDAQEVKLNIHMWKGEQFHYITDTGVLTSLPTESSPFGVRGGKPRHRMRQKFNFISQLVEGKVSAATQRVPSYEILPSTTEPDDEDAAKLAQQEHENQMNSIFGKGIADLGSTALNAAEGGMGF